VNTESRSIAQSALDLPSILSGRNDRRRHRKRTFKRHPREEGGHGAGRDVDVGVILISRATGTRSRRPLVLRVSTPTRQGTCKSALPRVIAALPPALRPLGVVAMHLTGALTVSSL